MQPSMLLKLLRKLTVDVSKLSEYTTVALRVSDYSQKVQIVPISYLDRCMILSNSC